MPDPGLTWRHGPTTLKTFFTLQPCVNTGTENYSRILAGLPLLAHLPRCQLRDDGHTKHTHERSASPRSCTTREDPLGRTWSGHPRLRCGDCGCLNAWMPGTSPGARGFGSE